MTLKDYRTEEDWAAERGVGLRTIRKERALRTGPAFVKIGRKIFYRPAAIEAWLLAQEVAAPLKKSA